MFPACVGGDGAQVVVAVGERGGVPVDRVGGVCVGVDRGPGAAACRPVLELGGVDAGAAVGRVGGDGERAGDEGAVCRSRQRAGRVRVVDDDILDGGVERVAGAVGHADEHADVAVGGLARPGDAVVRARRARADRGRGRAGGARAVEVRERVDARGGVGAGAGQLLAVPDRARERVQGRPARRRVVDRDRPRCRGGGVSGCVGGDGAQVVVAVGERGGVPVDRVGGVCVGVDRRPGAAARRPVLELGGVDAGAAVGRVGGDGDGAAAEEAPSAGAVSEPVGSVASKRNVRVEGVSALPTSSVAKTLTV